MKIPRVRYQVVSAIVIKVGLRNAYYRKQYS